MNPVYYFDIAALVLLFVLLVTILSRKMTRGRENIVFLMFLLVSMLATTFSLTTGLASNWPGAYPVPLRYFMHTSYLLFRNLIGPCYAFYIVTITDTWEEFRKNFLGRVMIYIPYIVVFVMLVCVNPFAHVIFYIDSNRVYHRGELFILLYVAALLYFVYGMGYLIKRLKLLEKSKALALLSLGPLTVFSIVLQFFRPDLLIEMFCTMISNVLMFLAVHRPEESMDPVTGLKNMVAFTEDARRYKVTNKPIDMIIVSIANYENISSILGYEMSEVLLKRIANGLRDIATEHKATDIYHIGSGRFHFVIPRKNEMDNINAAKQMNSLLRDGIQVNNYDLSLVAYVSYLRCPEDLANLTSILRYSNELSECCEYNGQVIYAAKVLKDSMKFVVDDVGDTLEDAMINNRFEVYYQPIYSVTEQRFTSAEALLRMQDENGRFIPPSVFIPAAERNGMIHRIGDFVLESVCKFIASDEFVASGIEYVEINLSVSQCMQKGLANRILALLEKYQVQSNQINLEITETAVGFSQNILMENLDILSQAGVTFSLDDFGTGYSNMVRIASLPLRIVKLDKSFVDRMDNEKIRMIVQNIIKLIKDVNMEIVVEGVETADMAQLFAEYACEYIQGYYYAKPMPMAALLKFLSA